MLAEEKGRRQSLLEECVCNMSKEILEDEAALRELALKLSDIYVGDFHHNYAGFFTLILEISHGEKGGNIDFLSENIESLRQFIEKDFVSGTEKFKEIYKPVDKLCDHLNLEIGRLNYYSITDNKVKDMDNKTQKLNVELSDATNKLNEASLRASSIQTELIAVLSIFAAIVVTFSGGLTILGSAMTSISTASNYEAVLMAIIICGIVMFNTIFLMMYLVSKITERSIYSVCKKPDCLVCSDRCKGIKIIKKRLPYVFYFNLFALFAVGIDLIIWLIDIKYL